MPYPKFGSGPGLERVSRVAEKLALDLAKFGEKSAVIVGSNGKGSTAAMCASLLQQAAAPVGLFTSPHLLALNERFRIDGEDITDGDLQRHWERVAAAANAAGVGGALGGFEFLFLIAADWFAARGCSHAIWEAGIGGRLDPVRLIAAKRLALTSLDLEHTQLLGDTLEDIARDKLDAAPQGATVFVSESCLPQRAAIEAHANSRGVQVQFVHASELALASLPLHGAHQRQNAALAVRLSRSLARVDESQVMRGLEVVRWPGRLEIIDDDPLTIIDVGHTPAGVRAALAGFNEMKGGRDAVLVCGVSHDKDAREIVAALASAFSVIVCASARHKGAPASEIAVAAASANPAAEIVIAESVADARQIARARDGAILVAGGLFLATEFKAVHNGLDPASLAFF